jgi:hypothetical protein
MAAAPRVPSAPSIAPMRSLALDNLKVLLVAAIIAGHGVLGYVDVEDVWPYNNVQEVALTGPTTSVLVAVALPFALFMIALLFLVAGLLTPGALDRKGPARFAVDRLLRLGIPFAVFTLLLWPGLLYALYRPLGHTELSYWQEFSRNYPDNGPLWFVGVLILLSLGYAGWRALRPAGPSPGHPITARALLVLALAIGAVSFLIRLALPFGGQGILDLNEWQWPECAAMFLLGTVAAGQGWLAGVPDRLQRQARAVTLVAAGVLGVTAAVALGSGVPLEDFGGGMHWPALVLALGMGVLTVFGPVWLLSLAQRRLDRPFPHGAGLARAGYGAFVLQGIPLLGVAVALRPVPLPAEVKALVVAVLSVAGSFALSWVLINRVPLLRRVL